MVVITLDLAQGDGAVATQALVGVKM